MVAVPYRCGPSETMPGGRGAEETPGLAQRYLKGEGTLAGNALDTY
jgi:hypothetical protein